MSGGSDTLMTMTTDVHHDAVHSTDPHELATRERVSLDELIAVLERAFLDAGVSA